MYNSPRPQKHPFEVVETSKYNSNAQIVLCPVCGIRRWNSAMRIHIAKQAREDAHKGGGAHLEYYNANTHEETKIIRVWDV